MADANGQAHNGDGVNNAEGYVHAFLDTIYAYLPHSLQCKHTTLFVYVLFFRFSSVITIPLPFANLRKPIPIFDFEFLH